MAKLFDVEKISDLEAIEDKGIRIPLKSKKYATPRKIQKIYLEAIRVLSLIKGVDYRENIALRAQKISDETGVSFITAYKALITKDLHEELVKAFESKLNL
jgi:hypothetical protein